ncbi:MAG TPA: THUMP domain-containing protein, partial [Castellaniella sp.]|nr:THUMP domain-containing protein [Castellaniella sp.]
MSDTPSRKTLSVKPRSPSSASPAPERKERQRSGARARQAALQQHAQQASRPAMPAAASRAAPNGEERKQPRAAGGGAAPRGDDRKRPHGAHAGGPRPRREPRREPPLPAPAERMEAIPTEGPAVPRVERKPRAARTPRIAETFPVFAPCPHGLEEALSLELQALGYESVRAGRAGCHFHADWTGILRANLYSRLATRILVQV